MPWKPKVTGFDTVAAQLRQAGKDLQSEKIVRESLREALEPTAARIRAEEPRSKHAGPHMADQIVVADLPSGQGFVKVGVGIPKGKGFLAHHLHFTELGTPRMAARPVMRRTFDSERGQIVVRFVAALRARLGGIFSGRRAA
jgi:HK97 gp10 family phage protein